MMVYAVLARLQRRPVRFALALAASAIVGALLIATIYWTLFDPRWVVFLSGVLFAAVLATGSSASKAEWIVARRTRQLERLRAQLAEVAARSAGATEAFKTMEVRARALGDALTEPVLLCDREEVCRFHNAAAARLAGREIAGKPLREVFGDAVYEHMHPYLHTSFAGAPARYPVALQRADYLVRQIPHPPGATVPEGIWLVLETRDAAPAADPAQQAAPEGKLVDDRGEVLYLRAIARELTGWENPRAKLTRALEEDRFLLLQQKIAPLVLGGEDPECYEILLRLQEEEENLLPPGGFLPDAERLGLMEPIDRWVVRHLVTHCIEAQRREAAWRPPLYCINVSTAGLREPAFGRYVQKQIQRGVAGRALCFELAEADVIAHGADARRLIGMLKPFGCRVAVDAFGGAKGAPT